MKKPSVKTTYDRKTQKKQMASHADRDIDSPPTSQSSTASSHLRKKNRFKVSVQDSDSELSETVQTAKRSGSKKTTSNQPHLAAATQRRSPYQRYSKMKLLQLTPSPTRFTPTKIHPPRQPPRHARSAHPSEVLPKPLRTTSNAPIRTSSSMRSPTNMPWRRRSRAHQQHRAASQV